MALWNSMDVIRCDEPDYLIWKWRPETGYGGERENSIRWGSSLRVRDGSAAVFVYKGGQDYIEGPYDDIIKTENFPVLADLVGKLYGGGSPFQAEVYFINLANLIQIHFGVPYFDVFDPRFDDFGIPTAVRGSLNFRIADYREFVKLHRLDEFDLPKFQAQIKDTIIRYVKEVVTNAPNEHDIPAIQMERHIAEINALVETKLRDRLREEYAVSVSAVNISDIEINKESKGYKKIEALTQNKAVMFTQGAATAIQGLGRNRFGANKIKKAVMGSDGFKLGDAVQKVSGVFGKKNSDAPSLPTDGFYVAVNGKRTGPFDTEKLIKMARKGKLTRESLVWKEGMESWAKAVEVEDLASIISTIPPEII